MRTVDFDRLATSAPLNRQAAVDYNARGEGPAQRNIGECEVFLAPPQLKPPALVPDYTGAIIGDAKVIGQRAGQPTDGKWRAASWVLRCTCGNFYLRNHKGLVEAHPTAPRECCPVCTRDRAALAPSKKKLRRASHKIREAIAAARQRTA